MAAHEAQKHFRAALAAAQQRPDKQQEAQAVTAIGTLMCFYHPGIQKQEDGWDCLGTGVQPPICMTEPFQMLLGHVAAFFAAQ